MTSSVNVSTVVVANTFDQWRIQTNLLKDDVNEIARGDFVKPTGNVTLTVGRIVLPNATGTMLDVTADARVSGKISVKNIEQDGGAAYLYSDSTDIKFRAGDGTFHANGNTRTRFLYNNTFFSGANVNATGFIETTGTYANGNVIMNVANVLVVRSVANSSNVYITGNVQVSNVATIGNARITLANTTTENVFTLHANTTGATANFANAYFANTNTVNAVIGTANVQTRLNATSANITTANVATLNVAAAGATANFANVTLANTTTTNASIGVLNVTTRENVVLANIVTANIGTLNVSGDARIATGNVTTLNVVTGNIGTLSVTSLSVTDPISAPSETDSSSYRLRVSQSTRGDGTFGVFQGTTNGNAQIAFSSTSNTWQATANDLGGSSTLITTANVKSTYANESANVGSLTVVKGANDNALAAFASSNVAANTVRVSAQSASTIHNAQLNFINSASINVSVTTGATGNANISFTANSSNPALLGPQGIQGTTGIQGSTGPQGIQGVQGTKGTDGIIGSNGSQGTTGAQGATGSQGTTGANGSNGSQGTTGANGSAGSQGIQGVQGTTGANGSNGTQGATGANGSNGAQGSTGATGSTGSTGAQGIQGITGTQGTTGSQGVIGATGPSTAINASNSSGGNFHLVGVSSFGSNYTPYIYSGVVYMNNGAVYATDFAATSDARLKNVLGFVDGANELLGRINGIRYTWNSLGESLGFKSSHSEGVELGVLAQEVEAVLPEAVHTDENGYKRVSYDRLIPVLLEAIKDLNARIKVLEAKE